MRGDRRQETGGGRARIRAVPVIGRPPWLLPLTGPADLLDHLLAEVDAHTGGHQSDDMALLAVMRDPEGPAPPAGGHLP